jgi:hypothetical protein
VRSMRVVRIVRNVRMTAAITRAEAKVAGWAAEGLEPYWWGPR